MRLLIVTNIIRRPEPKPPRSTFRRYQYFCVDVCLLHFAEVCRLYLFMSRRQFLRGLPFKLIFGGKLCSMTCFCVWLERCRRKWVQLWNSIWLDTSDVLIKRYKEAESHPLSRRGSAIERRWFQAGKCCGSERPKGNLISIPAMFDERVKRTDQPYFPG